MPVWDSGSNFLIWKTLFGRHCTGVLRSSDSSDSAAGSWVLKSHAKLFLGVVRVVPQATWAQTLPVEPSLFSWP